MGEKIKKAFAVIGAVFTVVFCTLLLVLRRRDSDGQRSGRTVEYDTRVEDGITDCEDGIAKCTDRVERCEERLHRAEEILREAIRRSRERESNSDNAPDSDSGQ